jgi:hypothetical protein
MRVSGCGLAKCRTALQGIQPWQPGAVEIIKFGSH